MTNQNSLTYKNNKEFNYTSVPGIIVNAIYYAKNCERLNIHTDIINNKLSLYIVDIYRLFLKCLKNRPELVKEYWYYIKKFYDEVYYKYENHSTYRTMYFKAQLKEIMKYSDKPNIIRFINDIKNNDEIPEYYYLTIF